MVCYIILYKDYKVLCAVAQDWRRAWWSGNICWRGLEAILIICSSFAPFAFPHSAKFTTIFNEAYQCWSPAFDWSSTLICLGSWIFLGQCVAVRYKEYEMELLYTDFNLFCEVFCNAQLVKSFWHCQFYKHKYSLIRTQEC